MRIISGKLKGKKINFLKNLTTRPLKDSVKENIFNILKHTNLNRVNIENASILDLYSGVGSFGLECISRGAKKVTFVEKDNNTIKILNENITKLSIDHQATLINDKIENALLKINEVKYDIFFFDPPFLEKDYVKNLDLIKRKKIFNKKHIVIIHREKNTADKIDNYVDALTVKYYGRSKIIFAVFN